MNTCSTVSTAAQYKESEREKSYTSFTHQGKPPCARLFREKRLKNLTQSLKRNGISPRESMAIDFPSHPLSTLSDLISLQISLQLRRAVCSTPFIVSAPDQSGAETTSFRKSSEVCTAALISFFHQVCPKEPS